MSSREASSTYRAKPGGTIHTETDNPALLALLRENSTASHHSQAPTSPSAPANTAGTASEVDSPSHPHEHAPHDGKEPVKVSADESQNTDSAPQPREATRTPQTPKASAKSPVSAARPVSQTITRKEVSNPHLTGERSTNQSSAVTPVSRIVPSEIDSASSELALLATAESRKSFVLSAATSEADFGEEADDEGDDTEDAGSGVGEDKTPVASPSQFDEQHGDRADQRNAERGPAPTHPPPAPGVPSAAPALPPGGRASASSIANSSVLRSSAVPSPDLNNPEHQRFVTPYASRRLKDRPVGRSSAVSFALTDVQGVKTNLNFPQEQSWSATQAARLRAGAGGSAKVEDPSSEKTEPDSGTPTPRNDGDFAQGGEPDPVDSLDFPTDRPAAETGTARDTTPVGERNTRRSTSPPPIEGGRVDGPDPQPRSQSTLDANGSSKTADSSPPRDSLNPTPQGRSKPSSALVTPQQRQETGSVAPSAEGSSIPNSARATPASILKKQKDPAPPVDRVYVESPTFTREEEDEYRFVSSRLDNNEEDLSSEHPTFRGLDQQAVNTMEGGAAVGIRATRKPFKQVRYQDDEDRYEDREEILQYSGTTQQQQQEQSIPVPKQRQYVLKSKSGSAQAANHKPQQPVKGLLLPSGPSYDPADEEDLKRETSYQRELKDRLSSIQRSAEDTVIPRLPLWQDSEDQYRDSLDIPEDVELDSERLQQHRNSIDLYEQQRLHKAMQNTQWGDPPPPPPGPPQHTGFPLHPPQRQAYGNSLRQGYAEPQRGFGDPQRQGYADPQRLGYADPQGQRYGEAQRGYGSPERRGYGEPQRGYAEPPPGYGEPPRQGYADPQRQGYGEPQRGYGGPEWQHGYANPQRGYGEPQRQGYGDPNDQGGYFDMYQQEQLAETPRGQNGYAPGPGQPQPVRGDPRFSQPPRQQAPPHLPQGGYYAQETQPPPQGFHPNPQQYAPEGDPWVQGQGQGHYMERGGPAGYAPNAEPQDGFYLTEPRSYPQGPGPVYGQVEEADGGNRTYYAQNEAGYPQGEENDRYQLEDNSQKSTARENYSPPKPDYDYVSHNKADYGRLPKRTYKKLHEVKKEEEEKLNHIFIHPKVKGKSQKGSRDASPTRHPAIEENPGEDGPEELWAQRSASLARAKNSKKGAQGKKKPSSNTSMLASNARRMYHSDSSIPNTAQPPQAPPPANQMQLVPAPPQPLPQISPVHSPPYRQPLDLKPISQQLITEDGQRISVDVNLRLISPTIGVEPEVEGYGRQPMGNQRHTGQQYPVENMLNGQQPYGIADGSDQPARYSADDVLSAKNVYTGGAEANGLPGGYTSDSTHDYGNGGYTTNPYKKIPPIPTSSGSDGAPRSAPVHSEGSYMLSYLREKEKQEHRAKPWYRVYGLKDYKRMQNEVRLGTRTLGPDLDNETYKERRERMLRQTEYAKAVKDKNTKELMAKKPPAFPRTKEQDDMLSKRKLAVEYAKNVPKPTVKPRANPYNSYELASKLSPIAKPSRSSHHSPEEPSVEVLDLEKLHERHERDKQSAEMIRQKAQGVVS